MMIASLMKEDVVTQMDHKGAGAAWDQQDHKAREAAQAQPDQPELQGPRVQ